eukprot:7162313-Alexandrium_andersonii.AAC.1
MEGLVLPLFHQVLGPPDQMHRVPRGSVPSESILRVPKFGRGPDKQPSRKDRGIQLIVVFCEK